MVEGPIFLEDGAGTASGVRREERSAGWDICDGDQQLGLRHQF